MAWAEDLREEIEGMFANLVVFDLNDAEGFIFEDPSRSHHEDAWLHRRNNRASHRRNAEARREYNKQRRAKAEEKAADAARLRAWRGPKTERPWIAKAPEVLRLHAEGLSQRAIATRVGVSHPTVAKILKQNASTVY